MAATLRALVPAPRTHLPRADVARTGVGSSVKGMTLAHGDPLVMIPGPSVMPDSVMEAFRRPLPNIYEGDLVRIIYDVLDRLPPIARTKGSAYVAVSNGHGAWEMALTNTLSRGDHVLVAEAGHFATSWAQMMRFADVTYDVVAAPHGQAVDPAAVEAALVADTSRRTKAVLVAHVDTATSVRNDIAAIRAAIDRADHPALLMVDAVASLGCDAYEMDAWGVDVTVAATQKGLMVPPGLGFVFVSDKALAAHRHADLRTGYWDFTARTDPDAHYWIFCGTPPISHLYALTASLDLLEAEGIEAVWARHRALADAVRAAVGAWHTDDGLRLVAAEPAAQSNAVTVLSTGTIDSRALQWRAESGAGLVLGIGIGDDPAREFRIGHMGHVTPPMVLGALGTIEAALLSLSTAEGVPTEQAGPSAAPAAPIAASGVAAAAKSLATRLAEMPSRRPAPSTGQLVVGMPAQAATSNAQPDERAPTNGSTANTLGAAPGLNGDVAPSSAGAATDAAPVNATPTGASTGATAGSARASATRWSNVGRPASR